MLLMSAVLGTARRQTKAINFEADRLFEPEKTELMTEEESEGETEADEAKDEKDLLIDQLKDELKRMRATLHASEVETRNIRKELSASKSLYEREHRELADLREIVFNHENGFAEEDETEKEKDETAYEFPYETNRRTVIFGGHGTFLKAIKPMLPNVRFVDARNMTFSPEIVRNADIVWLQTNYISHPMFWNVVKYAKQYGVQLRYFLYASAEKCAGQVVEADQKM